MKTKKSVESKAVDTKKKESIAISQEMAELRQNLSDKAIARFSKNVTKRLDRIKDRYTNGQKVTYKNADGTEINDTVTKEKYLDIDYKGYMDAVFIEDKTAVKDSLMRRAVSNYKIIKGL